MYGRDKLSRRELGELLVYLGRLLSEESDVSIERIEEFLDRLKKRKGYTSTYRKYSMDYLDRIVSYVNSFRTSEDLFIFLEAIYKISIPFRLRKQVLVNLGVGTILTSRIDLEDAKTLWREREEKINSINIYEISKEQLKKTLRDKELFPDGYAIVPFARRFRIKLPRTKNKEQLIDILLMQIFERPLNSKKIGRWGLNKKDEG